MPPPSTSRMIEMIMMMMQKVRPLVLEDRKPRIVPMTRKGRAIQLRIPIKGSARGSR
ncbi:hypothetical protein AAG607_14480 [Citromicrobium bathyomarinum]|uniref:hypothetical protein n=1 Tax=Citromicrobium bathyomarinum TaxID=72174 RepID=UPI00315A1D71